MKNIFKVGGNSYFRAVPQSLTPPVALGVVTGRGLFQAQLAGLGREDKPAA